MVDSSSQTEPISGYCDAASSPVIKNTPTKVLLAPSKLSSVVTAESAQYKGPNGQSVKNMFSHTQPNKNNTTDKNAASTSAAAQNSITVKEVSYQTGLHRYFSIANKRKLSPQKQNTQANKHIKTNTNQSNTQNRFSALAEADDNANTNNNQTSKRSRPPPIYLRDAHNNELVSLLRSKVGNDNFHIVPLKRDKFEETKIQVYDEDNYRKLVSLFETTGKHFYTYQLKSSKGLIAVLKGIESDVDVKEIKEALQDFGFEVKNIHNIKNKNKTPQPLFKVELTPECSKCPKNKTHPIYELRYLLNRRITVEEERKNKNIPQCVNCQEYGHTRTYCALRPVCVVCGGLHITSDCPSKNGEQFVVKCNNCGGPHPASYRGCIVYKELKNKIINRPKAPPRNTQYVTQKFSNAIPQPIADNSATVPLTYAQAIKAGKRTQSDEQTQNTNYDTTLTNITNAITQIIATTMNQLVKSMHEMFQQFIDIQKQFFNNNKK